MKILSKKSGWIIHPLEGGLGTYKETWDKLNAELYASNPYFDSNFIEPMLTYFTTGEERLCIHRQGDDIDGLVIVSPSGLAKWSIFMPCQAQITPLLLRYPENLQDLFFSLPGFSLALDIPCQDPLNSPLPSVLRDLLWNPMPHAHTMNVSLDGNFNKYLSTRSKGFRKNITRRFKKVQDAGLAIRIGRVTKSEEMKAAITRFGNMETMGWKGTTGTAIHSDNVQGHFYTDVMRNFAKRGKASIYELYFNEILVAMEICIASSNMLVLLKTTHNENQSSFSPGRMLLYMLLEDQFAKKHVKKIEFYTNADINELAWATHDRWISDHFLFRNSFVQSAYQEVRKLNDRLHGRSSLVPSPAEWST